MSACAFPWCESLAEIDREMCEDHRLVRVSSSGSWVGDRHGDEVAE